MKFTVDKQEKYTMLKLHEEKLDSSVAPQLKSELITLHAEGVQNIILDLSEVKYTDSSGLSALARWKPRYPGRRRNVRPGETIRSYNETDQNFAARQCLQHTSHHGRSHRCRIHVRN